MKVHVLVAHPDDEIIMCGATIDKLVKNGHSVTVTFLTKNEQAYFSDESSEQRAIRAVKESEQSGKLVGYEVRYLPFKDMELSAKEGLVIQAVVDEIRTVKPDIIITEHPDDRHIDHACVGRLVPEANFQSGNKLCGGNITWSAPLILQGEVNLEMTMPFEYDIVSRVSEENLDVKLRAFSTYESVMSEHGTEKQWLSEKIRFSAKARGKSAGLAAGEAFTINSYVPLTSISLTYASEVAE